MATHSGSGRPRKHPRPATCAHPPRPEHARGVCYQCSSNFVNQLRRARKAEADRLLEASRETPAPGPVAPDVSAATPAHAATVTSPLAGSAAARVLTGARTTSWPLRTSLSLRTPLASAVVDELLTLNVGGRLFVTARSTLTTREPHSMLARAALLHTSPHIPLFLDRDPHVFRFVLNYLRDGELVALPHQECERAQLLNEARHYALLGLVNVLEEAYKVHDNCVALTTFLTARPSSDGYFYLSELRVRLLWPELGDAAVRELDPATIALLDDSALLAFRFEEASELAVVAIVLDPATKAPAVLPLSHASLALTSRAVARLQLPTVPTLTARVEFWWKPAPDGAEFPQLCAAVTRRDWSVEGVLDFMHAAAAAVIDPHTPNPPTALTNAVYSGAY